MGPDYVRPTVDTPAAFKEWQGWKSAEPQDEVPRDHWWEAYGDKDLDALIEQVAAANLHTIVVLETGGAVLMPWLDKVAAVLESWYPGIRGSDAIANLLFG